MIDSEICEKIIRQYYREIYNYCYAKTNCQKQSAEDCTQEVFLVLCRKRETIENTENIRIWLYRTSDNVIKTYIRKNVFSYASIDDEEEIQDFSAENSFAEKENESPFDCLSEEERRIIEVYYDTDYGNKNNAAKALNMSLPSLYQKIHKIKKKLKNNNR